MNINVSLPTIIPNQLQPQTESAQSDNRRAELVPPSRQREAANPGAGVGAQERDCRLAQLHELGVEIEAVLGIDIVHALGEREHRLAQQPRLCRHRGLRDARRRAQRPNDFVVGKSLRHRD